MRTLVANEEIRKIDLRKLEKVEIKHSELETRITPTPLKKKRITYEDYGFL